MKRRKHDNIQKTLSYSPFSDFDGDGVPNILDCRPKNPNMDGFFRDLGGAVRKRVKSEVGVAKKRILERVSGEKELERRKEIREAESEGYYEERLKEAKKRGREKALIKKKPVSKKIEETVETIEKFAKKQKKKRKVGVLDVNLMLLGNNIRKTRKKTKRKVSGILDVGCPDIR